MRVSAPAQASFSSSDSFSLKLIKQLQAQSAKLEKDMAKCQSKKGPSRPSEPGYTSRPVGGSNAIRFPSVERIKIKIDGNDDLANSNSSSGRGSL